VAARAVAAVVTEGDRLGQYDVQPARAGDRGCNLRDLQGMGEPRPLVVGREDEDLGLPSQAPECRRVQDPVPIALETGPPRISDLLDGTAAGPE